MIVLTQHVPGYVDGVEPKVAMAKTIEMLLQVPWVANYSRPLGGGRSFRVRSWPDGRKASEVETEEVLDEPIQLFHRWSIADPGTPRQMLMAEHEGGDRWWVVGYLQAEEAIPLPTWEMTPAGRARVERQNRGEA